MYEYNVSASGGSGAYIFTSLDPTIADVLQTVGTTTVGKAVGKAAIRVSDANNPNHYGMCAVTVLKPTVLEFVDGKVEALVGDLLRLSLKVGAQVDTSEETVFFHDCRKMQIKLSFSDASVFEGVVSDDQVVKEVTEFSRMGLQNTRILPVCISLKYV